MGTSRNPNRRRPLIEAWLTQTERYASGDWKATFGSDTSISQRRRAGLRSETEADLSSLVRGVADVGLEGGGIWGAACVAVAPVQDSLSQFLPSVDSLADNVLSTGCPCPPLRLARASWKRRRGSGTTVTPGRQSGGVKEAGQGVMHDLYVDVSSFGRVWRESGLATKEGRDGRQNRSGRDPAERGNQRRGYTRCQRRDRLGRRFTYVN